MDLVACGYTSQVPDKGAVSMAKSQPIRLSLWLKELPLAKGLVGIRCMEGEEAYFTYVKGL